MVCECAHGLQLMGPYSADQTPSWSLTFRPFSGRQAPTSTGEYPRHPLEGLLRPRGRGPQGPQTLQRPAPHPLQHSGGTGVHRDIPQNWVSFLPAHMPPTTRHLLGPVSESIQTHSGSR